MTEIFRKPFVLALMTAVTTSVLGYLINQLPEIPNKEQSTKWIVIAVVVTTLAVWFFAVLQNQQNASDKATVVRGNTLRGKKNKFRISQKNVDVSRNVVAGEDQEFIVDDGSNASGPSSGRKL